MKLEVLVPALFLLAVLSFFVPAVPTALRRAFTRNRPLVFAVPALLSVAFCLAIWLRGVLNPPLVTLIVIYTLLPAVAAFIQRQPGRVSWTDFIVILLLWLPIEFNIGSHWVPRPAQGYVHTCAYGVSIILALVLFLGYRQIEGVKFHLPRRLADFLYPLAGFAIAAPILISLGWVLSFLQSYHVPATFTWSWFVTRYFLILAGIALPEETLFRGLIQNCLMQKLGQSNRTLLLAALVFGASHLNNGPQALPNWRYMILATIAGFIYGKVFQKASSVLSSAMLHALVNTVRHAFF